MACLVSIQKRYLCSETRTRTPETHLSQSPPHGGFLTEALSRENQPAGLLMVVSPLIILVRNLFDSTFTNKKPYTKFHIYVEYSKKKVTPVMLVI